jgi:hypothetical protein
MIVLYVMGLLFLCMYLYIVDMLHILRPVDQKRIYGIKIK